jgi:VanZ family protein
MNLRSWSAFISIVWVVSIGIVSFCSLTPRVEFPIDFWQADKVYHFIAYGWLAILPMIGYEKSRPARAASFSMILLGILLEIGQLYVPGRLFSLADIAMNTAGVIFGFFCGDYSRHHAETLRNIFTPS